MATRVVTPTPYGQPVATKRLPGMKTGGYRANHVTGPLLVTPWDGVGVRVSQEGVFVEDR